jgi:hypothetical protein
MDMM